MSKTKELLEDGFLGKIALTDKNLQKAIATCMEQLDTGEIRVAQKTSDGSWHVSAWVKQAILLYFRTQKIFELKSGDLSFADKVPVKRWKKDSGVRVVPPAVVRYSSFIEEGVILMPSFINVGAYVGAGTMVDTWATVGSCAQIGKNVHLSGGVGIGGVLEPVQANPVCIEDNVFVGSRSIIVEGCVVEDSAVIAAGVSITSSSRIVDVSQEKPVIYKGRVPARAVVIPGTTEKEFPSGKYQIASALIIGYRTSDTDKKTSLNQALREFEISV